MLRKFSIVIISLLLAAPAFADTPSHEGKPLAHWVEKLDSQDAKEAQAAINALHSMGETSSAARTAILEGVVVKGELEPMVPVSAVLINGYGRFGKAGTPELIKALEHENDTIRRGAATAIFSLGPDGAAAVPALVRRLEQGDEAIESTALHSLTRVGPAAVQALPFLIKRLEDGDLKKRERAMRVLAAIGPTAAAAKEKLLSEMSTKDSDYREEVVKALVAVVPGGGEDVVAALTDALDDQDERVIQPAVQALGRIGPSAKAAAGRIEKLLADDRFGVPIDASLALWQITNKSEKPLSTLIKRLDNEYDNWLAADALGEMGAAALEAAPRLVKMLSHKQGYPRMSAARALGKIGPSAAKIATPALIEAAKTEIEAGKTERDSVCAALATALWRIEKKVDLVMPLVLPVLDSRYGNAQIQAMQLITDIGPPAAAAKPKLELLLKHDRDDVRQAATAALAAIAEKK